MRAAWWWIDRWRQSRAYTDMSAEEQGLYRNLCDEVWLRENHVIPDDQRILARVSGDPEAWSRCGKKVLSWMTRTSQGWTHQTALEVIQQSKRRAENQKRYRSRRRNRGGNADGNETDNRPDNKPDSLSPSLSLTEETDLSSKHARARDEARGGNGNPFVDADRPKWEREALALTNQIADLTGEDGAEIFARAAHYEGALRQKVNPAGMTSDRLANTVLDLRATLKAEQEKHGGRP